MFAQGFRSVEAGGIPCRRRVPTPRTWLASCWAEGSPLGLGLSAAFGTACASFFLAFSYLLFDAGKNIFAPVPVRGTAQVCAARGCTCSDGVERCGVGTPETASLG